MIRSQHYCDCFKYSDSSIRISDCSNKVFQCFQRKCANLDPTICINHLHIGCGCIHLVELLLMCRKLNIFFGLMWNSNLSYNKHIECNSVLALIITFVKENLLQSRCILGNIGVFRNGPIADNLLHIRLVIKH